jgi:hypothetical protein
MAFGAQGLRRGLRRSGLVVDIHGFWGAAYKNKVKVQDMQLIGLNSNQDHLI